MFEQTFKISIAAFFFAGIGCATSTAIIGPDGTENQLVSCTKIETCYSRANEVCHGPYKIVNTSNENIGADGSMGIQTKLLVKCGK